MGSPSKSSASFSSSRRIFSTYSQMCNDFSTLSFAARLRTESDEDYDEVIGRLLPMARVIPGEPVNRRVRKLNQTAEACTRVDCSARRQKLEELASENDPIKQQIQQIEAEINAVKQKTLLAEKNILATEDRNEALTSQIEELRAQLSAQEVELQHSQQVTDELNKKLAQSQDAVRDLQEQVEIAQHRGEHRSEASPSTRVHVVFGQRSSNNAAAQSVQQLDDWERQLSSPSSSDASFSASMFATQNA